MFILSKPLLARCGGGACKETSAHDGLKNSLRMAVALCNLAALPSGIPSKWTHSLCPPEEAGGLGDLSFLHPRRQGGERAPVTVQPQREPAASRGDFPRAHTPLLWRQHLSVLCSPPEITLLTAEGQPHRRTWPRPGGIYGFCVGHRDSEMATPRVPFSVISRHFKSEIE